MYTFLMILIIIAAILLIGIVLIQPGKGGDMITGMGTIGGSISSMFGSRRAADILTKWTVGLAIALILLVIVTNKFFVGNTSATMQKAITEGVVIPSTTKPAPIQTTPAPTPTQQEQPAENK